MEITTTKHHLPHIWGWEIPVYLFLGGLVAGIMILSGARLMGGRRNPDPWPWAPMLAVVLLSAGMGALFLDLQHRWYVWRLYLTFQPTSPMSWGSWILLLVYPALLAAAILHPPHRVPFGSPILARVRALSMKIPDSLVAVVGMANLAGGVSLGIYTGILLGTLSARPLWNSAILGPLFLLSGLSTAAALLHLLSMAKSAGFADMLLAGFFRLLGDRHDHHGMLRWDNAFLSLEVAALLLFLLGLATGPAVQKEAVALLLTGPWAPLFWCGVVFTGLVLPLVLQALELTGRIAHTALPALLVLGGGFLLRWVLVFAGQASHW